MTYREIKVEEENLWFLGCLTPYQFFPDDFKNISPSCVLIPSNQVNNLSEHEIGKLVKKLTKESDFYFAEVLSVWVANDGRSDWENLLPYLEPFEESSQTIDEAIVKLRQIRDKQLRREKGKASAPEKRKEIKSNYDSLFVKIGRRDGFKCAEFGCSNNDLEIDHIQPLAENGTNDLSNLQLLCKTCNLKKSDSFGA